MNVTLRRLSIKDINERARAQDNVFFDVNLFPSALNVDTDGEGLSDFDEAAGNTNAELVDTDGDGFSDPRARQ